MSLWPFWLRQLPKYLTVFSSFQANIFCPFYSPDETNSTATTKEQYIIYSVTRDEYETCNIVTPNPKVVADCRTPHRKLYFTITFRTFTPSPGGMEFRPGQDYFFISTSDPENIHQKSGGRCSSHNMRVLFKTAELGKSIDVVEKSTRRPTLHSGVGSSDIVLVDNDVTKTSVVDGGIVLGINRRPSPKLDPLFYYPAEQPVPDGDANDVTSDVDINVVTSYRRQSRNQEEVKPEASRLPIVANSGSKNLRGHGFESLVCILFIFARQLFVD